MQATILPGSVGVHDKAAIHLFRWVDDGTIHTFADFNEFVEANQFPPDQVAEIRDTFAAGKRYRGGGGAAPIWEIWI